MTDVDLYVDPCCPFAQTAYRWLSQARRHRPTRRLLAGHHGPIEIRRPVLAATRPGGTP